MSVPDPVIPKDLQFTIQRPWVRLTRGSRSV
jgi:hypothetical protein